MTPELTTAGAACVFVVRGAASPQLPLRLLNFFAQQDLLPEVVYMTRADGGIAMRIAEATLDAHRAAAILAKMQALPEVVSATLDGIDLVPIAGGGPSISSQQGVQP